MNTSTQLLIDKQREFVDTFLKCQDEIPYWLIRTDKNELMTKYGEQRKELLEKLKKALEENIDDCCSVSGGLTAIRKYHYAVTLMDKLFLKHKELENLEHKVKQQIAK